MILNEGRIRTNEIIVLTVLVFASHLFLEFPRVLVAKNATAAWLVPLIVIIYTLPGIWGFGVLIRAGKGTGIVEGARNLLGGPGVLLLTAITVPAFLLTTALSLREFAEAAMVNLPRTPISMTVLLILVPSMFAAYIGSEVLGRVAWLTMPWLMGGVLFILAGTIAWASPLRIFPFPGIPWDDLFLNNVQYSSIYFPIYIAAFLYSRTNAKMSWARFCTVIIAFIAVLAIFVMILFLMVFPYPMAREINIPLFQMSRLIILGRFFQRVESIFILAWMLIAYGQLSASLYFSAALMAQGLRLPDYRPLLPLFSLAAYALAFLPATSVDTDVWLYIYLPYVGLVNVFIIPFLMGLVGWYKGRSAT